MLCPFCGMPMNKTAGCLKCSTCLAEIWIDRAAQTRVRSEQEAETGQSPKGEAKTAPEESDHE